MLKLKEIKTKPVIYQGLEVDVPADTNFMWLRHTDNRTALWASVKEPVWHNDHKLYIPPSDATLVAVLEHVDLTEEQVKASLETDESLPTAQDLKQLAVVKNLVKNLYGFANNLERNLAEATHNPSPEGIQALLKHVYADDGELDTFYNHSIQEAADYDILDEDEASEDEYETALKLLSIMLE